MSDLVGNPKDRFSHDTALIFQAREHCMSLLESALRDNYVKYYQDIPAKMAAKDYEPRICAIDLEYEVFRGILKLFCS